MRSMQARFFVMAALLGFSVIPNVWAKCDEHYGLVHCTDGQVESIHSNGVTTVEGSTVKGATIINGDLTAKDAIFNDLNVNGMVKLDHCEIKSHSIINGSVESSRSTFDKTITLASNNSVFNQSRLDVIRVEKPRYGQPQVLYLKNKSLVNEVRFDSGQGVVYLSVDSRIGKIEGGKIIKESR